MECFAVYKNEIEGRLDPFYYRPEFRGLEKKIKECKWGFVKFEDIIVEISGGATPKIDGNFYTNEKEGIPFLRVQNITEEGIKLEDVKFIKKEVHEKILKRSQLHENELVFTITGRIGNTAVVPKGFIGNINQHSVRIKLKEQLKDKKITPEYIALFFNTNIGQKLSFRKTTGGTRPALDYEAIKQLIVPLPNYEKQEQLLETIKTAYTIKKQKETKAKQLLESINDYVLSELDIKIPELKDQMTFVVYANDIKDGRMDAYYYQPKFEKVERAIEMGKYEVKELRYSFDGELVKGTLPKENEKNGEVKVLQIKNIHKNGSIDISEYLTAKNIFRLDQKLNKGELIIVVTGATIGKVGLWYFDEEFYLGGDMVKFKVNKESNPFYIQAFLLSDAGQYQILREITGATNKHLSPADIEKIKIPLPPLEIQNKIAEEVRRRMEKAEQLQKEAKEILEKAKQEIENIILNGENNEN